MDIKSNLHPFDRATALTRLGERSFVGETIEDYSNVVGTFGGVTSATILRAVLESDDRLGDPVAHTVNFCGAVSEGKFDLKVVANRTGKYTQHWSTILTQKDEIRATASTVCGVRSEVYSNDIKQPPEAVPFEECAQLPTKNLINWLEQYSFRFSQGAPSLSGVPLADQGDPKSVLWINDNPERTVDLLSLAAMMDCFFPRLLHTRGKMVPFGTVTMTNYFHATREELSEQGTDPLLGEADAKIIRGNFHDQEMRLWGNQGRLLASGSQLVWYKE